MRTSPPPVERANQWLRLRKQMAARTPLRETTPHAGPTPATLVIGKPARRANSLAAAATWRVHFMRYQNGKALAAAYQRLAAHASGNAAATTSEHAKTRRRGALASANAARMSITSTPEESLLLGRRRSARYAGLQGSKQRRYRTYSNPRRRLAS